MNEHLSMYIILIQAKIETKNHPTNFDLDSIRAATHCYQDHDFMLAKQLSGMRDQNLIRHHFALQRKRRELDR